MPKFSYLLHDDYEDFASRYLGVEYEDLVNLEKGYNEEEYENDSKLIEYEIPSLF